MIATWALLKLKAWLKEYVPQKLDWQRYGLYPIIERIKKVAYRLDLPASVQIYNVFLVSLLRDHMARVSEESPEPQPLKLAIDLEVREYEVEAIFASQIQTNPPNPACVPVQNCLEGIH